MEAPQSIAAELAHEDSSLTLADAVSWNASHRPDDPAFICEGGRVSWSEYESRSRRLAQRLCSLGLARGEHVAVLLPDGPAAHIAFLGVERAGLVIVGLSWRAGAKEVDHVLRATGSVALISRPVHRDASVAALVNDLGLRHHVIEEGDFEDCEEIEGLERTLQERRREPDELYLLNSTSGTTGLPKVVMHNQSRWKYFHRRSVDHGGLRPTDVFLVVVPTAFSFGVWTAHFTPTLLGAPVVRTPRFTPEQTIELIERHRVTVLAAVSTQFIMMLRTPEFERTDLSALRVMFTGGEAVPYEPAAEFERQTGASVLQFYGSSEAGLLSGTTTEDTRENRLRTAGRVLEDMNVRLYDEDGNDVTATGGPGQPACRGPSNSSGYYEDDEANAELFTPDGGVRTGDIVTIDASGYLKVVGRTADLIIRGGKNISGPAVEADVLAHPAISVAAAVAMPDPVFGERVCVYAELRPGESLSLAGLVDEMKARGVSVENLPERLIVVDALPRSSTGKVAKGELRRDIRSRISVD